MNRPGVEPSSAAFDDDESGDAAALDLSPRRVAPRRRRPSWLGYGALVLLLGLTVVVVINGLSDAATYFYNVDDAVAARDEIGDRRLRLQGNVIDGSVDEIDGGLRFTLAYGDAELDVTHIGDVPPLFQPAIPVVVEGRFDGVGFASDRVLVKHDETYDEANPNRLDDANTDAERRRSTTP